MHVIMVLLDNSLREYIVAFFFSFRLTTFADPCRYNLFPYLGWKNVCKAFRFPGTLEIRITTTTVRVILTGDKVASRLRGCIISIDEYPRMKGRCGNQ